MQTPPNPQLDCLRCTLPSPSVKSPVCSLGKFRMLLRGKCKQVNDLEWWGLIQHSSQGWLRMMMDDGWWSQGWWWFSDDSMMLQYDSIYYSMMMDDVDFPWFPYFTWELFGASKTTPGWWQQHNPSDGVLLLSKWLDVSCWVMWLVFPHHQVWLGFWCDFTYNTWKTKMDTPKDPQSWKEHLTICFRVQPLVFKGVLASDIIWCLESRFGDAATSEESNVLPK